MTRSGRRPLPPLGHGQKKSALNATIGRREPGLRAVRCSPPAGACAPLRIRCLSYSPERCKAVNYRPFAAERNPDCISLTTSQSNQKCTVPLSSCQISDGAIDGRLGACKTCLRFIRLFLFDKLTTSPQKTGRLKIPKTGRLKIMRKENRTSRHHLKPIRLRIKAIINQL